MGRIHNRLACPTEQLILTMLTPPSVILSDSEETVIEVKQKQILRVAQNDNLP